MNFAPADISIDNDIIEEYEKASEEPLKSVTDLEYERYLNQRLKGDVDALNELKDSKKETAEKYLRLKTKTKKEDSH